MLTKAFWVTLENQLFSALDEYPDALNLSRYPNILILGGGGFFGTWATIVVAFLAHLSNSQSCRMTSVSRFHLERAEWKSRLPFMGNVNFVSKLTSSNPSLLEDADLIIDMRLPETSVLDIDQLDQLIALQRNFYSLLEKRKKGAVLVLPSSGAVYGKTRKDRQGQFEDHFATPEDTSTYGVSKKLSEDIAIRFLGDGPIFMPRIFSALGPFIRSDSPLIMNAFLDSAIREGGFGCSAGPHVFRDFASPIDIIFQTISLATRSSLLGKVAINVGSANVKSVQDFAKTVANLTGAELVMQESSDGQPDYYFPDLTLMNKSLGSPKTLNFERTLDLALRFYRERSS